MRKRDMALDYLAPFLARIGSVDKFSRNDAMKVKEECLNDLKQRLIDKANLIQARFEKVGRPRLRQIRFVKWCMMHCKVGCKKAYNTV